MTIAGKNSLSKGSARLLVRVNRSLNGPRIEWRSFYKVDARPINVLVEFNARDELELKFTTDKDDSKNNKENINSINTFDGRIIKIETFKIDEIIDCFANDSGDFSNALIVEVLKKNLREEMVLQFESEQEFRRTLFTYKYFKMRNRLANSSSSEHSDGSASPSLSTKSKSSMSSIENGSSSPDYNGKVFDYSKNNNGTASHYIKKFENINDLGSHQNYPSKSLDYMSINNIQRAKQNRSQEYNNKELKTRDFGEVGILNGKNSKSEYNLPQIIDKNKGFNNMIESKTGDKGEIDGLIYTDVEYESMEYPNMNYSNTKLASSNVVEVPQKPQRRKQLLRRIKGKAPPPPGGGESGWGGEQGRAQEPGKVTTVKISAERGERVPTKESDGFPLRINSQVPRAHMGASGYESDREEWRSRSTFSSSAFHSLARPARQALAVYYRLSSSPPAAQPPQPAPRKSSQRNQRNLQDYPKNFASPEYIIVGQIPNQEPKRTNNQQPFQQERIPYQKQQEQKYGKMLFNQEYKRNTLGGSMNYLNISNRLYGLTDKLKELGQNTQNRQQQWQVKPERKEKEKEREKEKGTLKPVIKKSPPQEGSKRPVVRTCSAEPPKKVTFSAFATVQVV